MESSRYGVRAIGLELAARVQSGEDQLDTGDTFFGVDVGRHAPSIVSHLHARVREQGDLDPGCVSAERFVDRVVDCLAHDVIGRFGRCEHAWAPAHRVQTFEDFYP